MSTAVPTDVREERFAIAGLIALVFLSVIWPAPVVWLNDTTIRADIRADHESFLMREGPEWDVAFWWLAGAFVIAIAGRDVSGSKRGLAALRKTISHAPSRFLAPIARGHRSRMTMASAAALGALIVTVAVVDRAIADLLLSIDQSTFLTSTSFVNRLGGGVAPALVTAFLGVAGIARGREAWVQLFVSIVLASIASAIVLHVFKLFGRVRPELFRAVIELDPGAGASFPSGHALSAFVIAGGIASVSRSRVIRATLFGSAVLIAITRVLTFRHWPSDVLFSAILGLSTAWYFTSRLAAGETSGSSGSYREEETTP